MVLSLGCVGETVCTALAPVRLCALHETPHCAPHALFHARCVCAPACLLACMCAVLCICVLPTRGLDMDVAVDVQDKDAAKLPLIRTTCLDGTEISLPHACGDNNATLLVVGMRAHAEVRTCPP